ncbi:hypothetical protein [Legionella drozanskii]|uniref:Uncharacterized protein n=1 Tax=Legionella drozanskii LLAP-1 TaxID=1212489 RepID=A0A0W0T1Q1_9GAMM|nr:hypothetical protein [Legionella drozanskii]KTC89125.1 hypothetical protein Ldro_0783 [Legionella drozanskii LLAP-1]
MKKKLLIAGMSVIFSFKAMADVQPTITNEEIDKRNRAMLAKAGIELPDSIEVSMVSANKYIESNSIKQNANDAHMATKMKEYLALNNEQQKNGYVKDNEPRAKELIELKHVALYHKAKYKGALSSESTHIRASIDELKIAYTFVGVPIEEMDLNIGVAPYGAYKSLKNGDDGDGWDGAVQFFDKKGIGSCAFTEHNRKLAHSGVELIKELVTYDVHNKPTIVLVKGNKESGFVYKLKWYDNTFSRELECANSEFSQQLRTEIIALANRIESYQQPS